MNTPAFQVGMAKMQAAFNAPVSEAMALVYEEVLGDLDDGTWAVAVRRALSEWTRPGALPPPAVLLGYAREMAASTGAIVDGESAWAAFTSRVLGRYSFGVTKSFDWPDELTREVVRHHLGFDAAAVHNLALLESEFDREKFRKRFVAEYNARRGTTRAIERVRLEQRAPYESPPLPPPAPLRRIAGGDS